MDSDHANADAPAVSTPSVAQEALKPELIILIHGTGAWQEDDSGDAWWQIGSDFSNDLLARLGPGFRFPAPGQLFKWRMGENSERRRRQAGLQLSKRIRELEQAGQPYHLIGHSHGGSVLWDALRGAAADHWLAGAAAPRQPLPYLRSCTTVGTPFLQFRGPAAPRVPLLRGLSVWGSPVMLLASLVVVGVVSTEELFPISWYAALGGILAVVIAFSWFFRQSMRFADGATIDLEAAASGAASALFADRWLSLWSTDDEAINALEKSRTFPSDEPIAPRLHVPEVMYPTDVLRTLRRPLLAPFYWFYNRLVAPRADRFIWSALQRRAQGNDRGHASIGGVGLAPSELLAGVPPLPIGVVAQLAASANEAAQQVLPDLRKLLGERDLTGEAILFGGPQQDLNIWRSLVHTSYFDNEAVRHLISRHIASHSGKPLNLAADPVLDTWYHEIQHWAHTQVANIDAVELFSRAFRNLLARYWLGQRLGTILGPWMEGYARKAYLRAQQKARAPGSP